MPRSATNEGSSEGRVPPTCVPGRAWFAGVAFDFGSAAPLQDESFPEEARVLAMDELPTVAHVASTPPASSHAPMLPRDAVRWQWKGDHASTVASGVVASVTRAAARRYTAIGPNTAHVRDFLICLVWPVLVREGGMLLHACAVELDGRAVLVLGPSGAGKTTAATQVASAKLFAKDLVAVFPADDRWWVAPMPGGNEPPTPMPRASRPCLPLAGALRVHKSTGRPRVDARSGAASLGAWVGASRHGCADAADHEVLLDSAVAISQKVPIGILHCVLGVDLAPCVRGWLGDSDD